MGVATDGVDASDDGVGALTDDGVDGAGDLTDGMGAVVDDELADEGDLLGGGTSGSSRGLKSKKK